MAEAARREYDGAQKMAEAMVRKLEEAAAESVTRSTRLSTSSRGRGRRAAAEEAAESEISMRAQLNESERELNEMRRSNERMVEAARAAAAAYCARSLASRSRDACRRAFSGWFKAACRTGRTSASMRSRRGRGST